MAVKTIFWNAARGDDIHIVNGAESMDLRTLLVIDDTVAGAKFATTLPAGVTLTFKPHYTTAAVSANVVGNFGAQVNTTTGVVKVTQAAPQIHSFLIEALVTDTNPTPANTFSQFIRADTHGGIRNLWLTPSKLHLHQGANGQKLTLLAEFTDGRMGPVNNIPGLTWSTSAGGVVGVNASTGALTVSAVTGDATITATLPASYQVGPIAGAAAPTAKVFCLAPWSTPRQAKLLGGSAGMAVRADVRNIVMLSEGFRSGESALFDQAAQSFTDFMRTSIAARPFKLCSSRLNFWTVFIASEENGTDTLTPLRPLTGDKSECVPDQLNATGPAQPASIQDLVERAGYPTTDDRNRAGTLSAADITTGFGSQKTEWITLYGAAFNTKLTEAIYGEWVKLADLRIADERDTAFGLRSGMWPNAQRPIEARSLGIHPFRTERAHIDPMLAALTQAGTGTALGDLWGPGKLSRPHVLFISLGGRDAGARNTSPETISVSIETDKQPRIDKIGPGMRTQLKPFAFPTTISLDARATFTHETAHSFSLLDEYGAAANFPATSNDFVKDVLNVQAVSTTVTAGLAGIDPSKLKWNLPRIDRAAVLVQQPTVAGANVEIIVVAGQAKFGVGDVVLLRQRPLSATAKISKEITVTEASTPVANGERVKLNGPAGAVTAADFPKGSIAFVQKKNGAVKLNLIADEIATHIKTKGVALNTAFGTVAAGYACVPKTAEWQSHWTVQRATNIPADPATPAKALVPVQPQWLAYIVGAYEGGNGFHCGVLHPTGICMMRQLEIPATSTTPKPGVAYEFCAVCAYVLVDALDPSKHAELDKNFIADRHYKATP